MTTSENTGGNALLLEVKEVTATLVPAMLGTMAITTFLYAHELMDRATFIEAETGALSIGVAAAVISVGLERLTKSNSPRQQR